MARLAAFLGLLAACALLASAGPLAPSYLRLEYRENPLGVDVKQPRFSWTLLHTDRGQAQSKYHLQVFEAATGASVWDATMTSDKSTNVKYAGKALQPDTGYTWRVMYFDKSGAASPWSNNATFSTGIFDASDWDSTQWIGGGNQLRTTFKIDSSKRIKSAFCYIIGLGYYKLDVNGRRVSDHELGAFTTYEKRIYYDTWDVVEDLLYGSPSGEHAIAVSLGNGWYSQPSVNVGNNTLAMRLSLQFTDGTSQEVVSSTDWKTTFGPVVMNDIYVGETYNASMETPGWTAPGFDDSTWSAAQIVNPPNKTSISLSSHAILPPIRIGETYAPCNMWESAPGVYVYDFCQNMAGFTTLKVPEGAAVQAGINITMLHAEAIHGPPPAAIFHHYGGNIKETTTYLAKGDGQAIKYTPLFTYMGFRYVQLTGYPGTPSYETLTAHFVHTDYEMSGDIEFSDPNLNGVQHITRTAAMSNFQSIPTDCPQRERRGWLGDAQLSCETNMHNFFMAAPYTSFVQQINDAQVPETGATQDCVPWYGHGHQPADPAWGSAYTFIADWVRTYYDDDQIVADHYPGIKAHLESLITQAKADNMDGLLAFSWWGDWCPPSGCRPDKNHHNSALVSSFMYIKQLRIVSEMAADLGMTADATRYSDLAASVSKQFVAHFYDSKNKIFFEPNRPAGAEELSVQTCISLAADLELIPASDYEAVLNNLVADVMKRDGHLNCGIVGIKYLLPTLSKFGRNDVALAISQTETQPSWVYMFQQGATTLWETWTGSRYQPVASWNHIMFGSQSAWYFQHLAGLQQGNNSRGYQEILFQPQVWAVNQSICDSLSNVDASLVTPRGLVQASWSCEQNYGACAMVDENSNAELSCSGGATISKVVFASFGTPNGTCNTEFEKWNCSSPNSQSVVEKDCLGKSSCTVPATNDHFGGDPCLDVRKHLSVAVSCSSEAETVFSYQVEVPVGSTAKVAMPLMGVAVSDVTILEGGKAIFKDSKYVPGVAGISGASLVGTDVIVEAGSGTYSFQTAKQ